MLNLTPHAITLRTSSGDVTFPPSGQVARVATVSEDTGLVVAGVRVIRNQYGTLRIFLMHIAGSESCLCLRQYNRETGAYE